MDINNLTSSAQSYASAPGTRTGDAVAVLNLKKALDVQAENAVQLIEAASEASPPADPDSSLGRNIDVRA
jgi:hypothetical protein